MKRIRSRLKIWALPLLLAALSGYGLIAALLYDGWGDALSWFALSAPIAATLTPVANALISKFRKTQVQK